MTVGFTTATSVIIIASQLKGLLGLSYDSGNFIWTLQQFTSKVGETRWPDTMLGFTCIVVLLFLRVSKTKVISWYSWSTSWRGIMLLELLKNPISLFNTARRGGWRKHCTLFCNGRRVGGTFPKQVPTTRPPLQKSMHCLFSLKNFQPPYCKSWWNFSFFSFNILGFFNNSRNSV